MNRAIYITGKSTTLKEYADIYDTIDAIKRIINENFQEVSELSKELQADNCEQTFKNIWDYVRKNIRYKNDDPGKEQLRRPQRTLFDKTGDCDDMSILISSILTNLGYPHELNITAYKRKDKWQHIYPAAFDSKGTRYVIDCVPEIPYFNYEAQPIKNKIVISMKLEELGYLSNADTISELTEPFDIDSLEGIADDDEEISLLQGLLGNVAIVDEDDEYDSVISGTDLKKNIIINQLVEARKALENEIVRPTELSQLNDNKTELQLINNIIENFEDEYERDQAIQLAISRNTLYQNFYKTIQYGVSDIVNGLLGEEDDDLYYLKLMKQEGDLDELLNEDIEYEDQVDGLGRRKKKAKKSGGLLKKIGSKIKKGVQKFKEQHPKIAKVGHALKKYSPATFGARKSLELFIRANTLHMAEKLAVGYASEAQAKKMGYTKAEWLKFVEGKDKAESKWYSLGGKKEYFRDMITKSKFGKQAGLSGIDLGVVTAVVTAVTKVFGAVINFFKNMKLKKANGEVREDTAGDEELNPETATNTKSSQTILNEMENENTNVETHEKSGVTVETTTDENGKEIKVYKDKDGNEISRFKAFFLKYKTMIIIVSIVLVVGIIGIIIWKARQRSMRGLGETGLSKRQENYIRRQGLNNRAYGAMVREEIKKDGKKYNKTNRRAYYKQIFSDAFSRPLSDKQTNAALKFNSMRQEVRALAKEKGGGPQAWKEAWAEVKKKR